jgi:NADH dehydrogenase/NADH:ubiquinone oxidoreductase subunit G
MDILDSLNSDITVSLKGSEVLRILPCFSNYNLSEWISDKTRFFYDSFDFFRIKKCWSKKQNCFVHWSHSLFIIKSLLLDYQKKNKRLGIFMGALCDLETGILSNRLGNKLGSSDIYSDFNCPSPSNLDFRSNYSFSSLESLTSCDYCLIVGSDLRSELPSLNLAIKNKVIEGSLVVHYIGPSVDLLYNYNHIGLGLECLLNLLQGKHPASLLFKKSKNPYIIVGEKFNQFNISKLIYSLADLNCLNNLQISNINTLRSKSASILFNELGINSLANLKKFDLLLLIGIDDLKPYRSSNPNSFIIYIGSHYSVYNLEMADLILPSSIFLEKNFTSINLENRVKSHKPLRKISGDTRSEWFILLIILSFFSKNNFYKSKKNLNYLLGKEYPFIAKNNFKMAEFGSILSTINFTLNKELFSRNVFNFYEENYMIRSSKNFKFCLNNLKQVQFKKKNVV